MSAGSYTVTITDANGCAGEQAFSIVEPAAMLSNVVGTNESVLGASDGEAELTVSGGTEPYAYFWSTQDTTEDIHGLAGNGSQYFVTITDANGCVKTDSVTIFTDCSPAGTPCDDGNPDTFNDIEDGNCNCNGTICHPSFEILEELYFATGGPQWKKDDLWLSDCEPCAWLGIACDQQGNVIGIDLANNKLSGGIPGSISELESLMTLSLSGNNLSDTLPWELFDLVALSYLDLSANNLSGVLPDNISNLQALFYLDLRSNNLSGQLPTTLGNLGALTNLYLDRNSLEGQFPASMSYLCGTLIDYNFSQNSFACDFVDFCNRDSTEYDILSEFYYGLKGDSWTNNTGWTIDCDPCRWVGVKCNNKGKVIEISLPSNNLSGNIPSVVGNLASLEKLDLSENNISGTIPSTLVDLANLNRLYLNSNQLVSPYPEGTASLCAKLQSADLSDNLFYCDFDAYCVGTCVDCEGADCDPLNIEDFVVTALINRSDDGSSNAEIELILDGGVAPYSVTIDGQLYTTYGNRLILRDLSCGSYSVMAESSKSENELVEIDLFIPQQIMSEYAVPADSCLSLDFSSGCLIGVDSSEIACVIWAPEEAFSDPYSLSTTICRDTGSCSLVLIDTNGDVILSREIRLHPKLNPSACDDGNGLADLEDSSCYWTPYYYETFDSFPLRTLQQALISLDRDHSYFDDLFREYGTPDLGSSIVYSDKLALVPFVKNPQYLTTSFVLALVDSADLYLKFVTRDTLYDKLENIDSLSDEGFQELLVEMTVVSNHDRKTSGVVDPEFNVFLDGNGESAEAVCIKDFTRTGAEVEVTLVRCLGQKGCKSDPSSYTNILVLRLTEVGVETEFCLGDSPSRPFSPVNRGGGSNTNVSSASPAFLERMENCGNFPGPEPDPSEDALCAAWQQITQCAQGKLGQKNFEHVLEFFANRSRKGDGNHLIAARDQTCSLPGAERASRGDLLVGYYEMTLLGYEMSMTTFVEVAELLEEYGVVDYETIAFVAENRRLYQEVSNLLGRTDLQDDLKREAVQTYVNLIKADESLKDFFLIEYPNASDLFWPILRYSGAVWAGEVGASIDETFDPGMVIEELLMSDNSGLLDFLASSIKWLDGNVPAGVDDGFSTIALESAKSLGSIWKATLSNIPIVLENLQDTYNKDVTEYTLLLSFEEMMAGCLDLTCLDELFGNVAYMTNLAHVRDELARDPLFLVRACGASSIDPVDYAHLFNHSLPQSCVDRLDDLGTDFYYQNLDNAHSPAINLDHFSVEITEMPDFDNDGSPDDVDRLFQEIREHFLDLASGKKDGFESNCVFGGTPDISWEFEDYPGLSPVSSEQWLGPDPTATIFYIDAGARGLASFVADDGAVIVSDIMECCWIFSTIATPESHRQPFSGHRQFGLRTNENGNLEFYTRAVDRVRLPRLMKALTNDACSYQDYFDIGYETWSNLMNEVSQFVDDHKGRTNLHARDFVRPMYGGIVEQLKTSVPIEIDCN